MENSGAPAGEPPAQGPPPRRGRLRAIGPNLALAGGALLFTFLALELGVRLFVDLREFAPRAVHLVDPERPIAFLPHRSWTYRTDELEYTVSFNSMGRRDVEWSDPVLADPGNILFIGDSFVLGNGVEDEASIPTRLERHFAEAGRPREVFNFGMPDGNPRTYGLLLEDALQSGIAADTVLVGVFVGNDFYPGVILRAVLPPQKIDEIQRAPAWRPRSQLLQFLRLRVSQSPRLIGWALGAGRLLGVSLYDTAGSYIFLRNPTPEQGALFHEILTLLGQMAGVSEQAGRELRLVIFPNKIQVENGDDLTSAVFDPSRPNQRILEYCEARGIACLDLLPVLTDTYERDGELLYYPIDRHLNQRGTAVAAQAIAAFLMDEER